MQVWTSATQASHVDVVARGLAVAGLGVAIASLLMTWQLWKRSGGELTATLKAHVSNSFEEWPHERVIFTVDVSNTGRMTATVRSVVVLRLTTRWKHARWLRWWYRLTHRESSLGDAAYPVEQSDDLRSSRWIVGAESRYPREIPPTGYLQVRALMDPDEIEPSDRWAQALVIRGDRLGSYSRRISMPHPRRDTGTE
jgi:hypothetical protein